MTRPSRLRRAPLPAVTLVLGGAMALAACGPATGSTPPAATEPPAATDATGEGRPCEPADLDVSSTGWGGAAGSRGADVTVVNGAAEVCSLDGPRVAVLDADGTVLLESEGEASEALLEPGASSAFSFTFSNWCEPGSALPLQVALAVGGDLVVIDALAMPTVDDLPPCNGEGQPPTLSTIPWAQG
ncbi:MAG TPA: DUF4232 domain-containing protein [Candidatus Limnocylindrales bacterium]|nr:DUF4232 domain-containing protein [Candidatus Limnocylindrales bacterium]